MAHCMKRKVLIGDFIDLLGKYWGFWNRKYQGYYQQIIIEEKNLSLTPGHNESVADTFCFFTQPSVTASIQLLLFTSIESLQLKATHKSHNQMEFMQLNAINVSDATQHIPMKASNLAFKVYHRKICIKPQQKFAQKGAGDQCLFDYAVMKPITILCKSFVYSIVQWSNDER